MTATGRDGGVRPQSYWVSLDGVEACGKSTQARLLADDLDGVLTREPGGTAVGQRIREVVLDPAHPELCDRTEALLYAADRAQHLDELVTPTLAAGRHVVSDRSWASSLAYQGVARGLGAAEVDQINRWALADRLPDLVIFVRVPVDEALARLGPDRDRLEAEGDDFHHRVDDAFARLAADDPGRWDVVDGRGDIDTVFTRVRTSVRDRLGV